MSGISNTTVNLIAQNALKKSEGCIQWKCIRLVSLFRPLGFKKFLVS